MKSIWPGSDLAVTLQWPVSCCHFKIWFTLLQPLLPSPGRLFRPWGCWPPVRRRSLMLRSLQQVRTCNMKFDLKSWDICEPNSNTRQHVYIYIYMCVCVCVSRCLDTDFQHLILHSQTSETPRHMFSLLRQHEGHQCLPHSGNWYGQSIGTAS